MNIFLLMLEAQVKLHEDEVQQIYFILWNFPSHK